MDLHAWITQQVDRAEAAIRAQLEGRRVAFKPDGGGPIITGTVTGVTQTPDGPQLAIAQYDVEPANEGIADVQAATAALRRCEADRRILARHEPQPNGTGFDDGWQCQTCSVDGGDGYQYLVPYPCPTIEDLAHAHGATDGTLAGLDHPRAPEPARSIDERYANGGILTPAITTGDVPEALRGPRWKP